MIQSELSHEEDSNESSLVLDIWDNQNCYKESCDNIKYNNDMIHSLFTIDKQPNIVHDSDVPTYGQVCASFLYKHTYSVLFYFKQSNI